MSGHSKWATIRRKKEKTDAARGRVFTKVIKEIVVAARNGGGDIDANPRLRVAVQAAKAVNMPQENITRAIKKGTGELPGTVYEEVTYEGYGPGGCAIYMEGLTDNRNRTVAEIRHIFTRYGGNLAETNAVAYIFSRKALIEVLPGGKSEDEIIEIALEAGAEDVNLDEDGAYSITGQPSDLETLRERFEEKGIEIETAEVSMIAKTSVPVDEKHVKSLMRLMEAFEEHDDIQRVYSNFDISPELLESLE